MEGGEESELPAAVCVSTTVVRSSGRKELLWEGRSKRERKGTFPFCNCIAADLPTIPPIGLLLV